MNTSILGIIKWIITKHGEDILGDPVRLKPIFADYAKNEPKEERIAFGRCIEMGCYREMKKAKTENERSKTKALLAQNLQTKTGIDIALCRDALDLVDAAIFGNVAPPQPVKNKPPVNKLPTNKKSMKWAGVGIITVIVIILVFSLRSVFQPVILQESRNNPALNGTDVAINGMVDDRVNEIVDERIETLRRITEYQEQIAGQLEQLRRQIEEDQNRPNISTTSTMSNTSTTQQQKTEQERLIEDMQNDLLMKILSEKRQGRRDITGRIKVLVLPTNYRGNTFRMDLSILTSEVQNGINIIINQARRYNQNISIDWEYRIYPDGSYISINNYPEGLSHYSTYKDIYRNYDHVVLVYAIDVAGRSYCALTGPLGRSEGNAIMWFKRNDGYSSGTLAHEIFHAFGAEDLYYEPGVVPPEVESNFKLLLGDSIMITGMDLDPISAWLIGWNKNPEPWYAWFIERRDMSVDVGLYVKYRQ